MRACTCPNCGAQLKVDNDDREFIYCEFCGTRIDLVDRRTVHTEHIIDDAKIKNAENISRIVNIFAAPVEEKQRQKEFERQRQLEEERREYEREQREEQERRENREAMEDGCAAVMGGCLVKCVKHPIIACIIIFLLLGSCMASSSSSTSSSSITSNSVSEHSSLDTSIITKYDYDYCYMYIASNRSRQYWLINLKDSVVCTINSYSKAACIYKLPSRIFSRGVKIDAGDIVYTFTSDNLEEGIQIKYGDEGPYDFEPVDVQLALANLTEVEHISDYVTK